MPPRDHHTRHAVHRGLAVTPPLGAGAGSPVPPSGQTRSPFALVGRVAVVTGGYGVLGGAIASGLADAGAAVAILGRRRAAAERKADEIREGGGDALALVA